MTQSWTTLGIEPTTDEALIRKAYAQLIRQYRPDSHPTEFSVIRAAFEDALGLARGEVLLDVPIHSMAPGNPAQCESPEPNEGKSLASSDLKGHSLPDLGQLQHFIERQDEAAASAWLDAKLLAARNGMIDEMNDFERALAQTLLSHDAPPLRFIEVCAEKLQWPTRWQELFVLLGATACARLKGLLGLAREHRFSSQFAANPWQRYLFSSASTTLPRLGRTALLDRARKVAEDWQRSCNELGVPGHLQALNPMAMRHVENHRLQRCDVANGLLLMVYLAMYLLTASTSQLPTWAKLVLCFTVFFGGCGLRLASCWTRDQAVFQVALPWLKRLGIALCALFFFIALAELELASISWLATPLYVLRWVFAAYLIALGLWLQWWCVRGADDSALTWKLKTMDSADDQWWEEELKEVR